MEVWGVFGGEWGEGWVEFVLSVRGMWCFVERGGGVWKCEEVWGEKGKI